MPTPETHTVPSVERRILVGLLALLTALAVLGACGPREHDPDARGGSATGAEGSAPSCELVGEWRHEHPQYASDIVICSEPAGEHRVRQAFADGTTYRTVLTPVAGGAGERYLRDPAFSDYYELLADGRLVLGDAEGVIVTLDPLR